MSNLVELNDLSTFKGLVFERLGLSSDQEELISMVAENEPITETAIFDLVELALDTEKEIETDVGELVLELKPRADLDLQVGLYAPETEIVLADVVVPDLHSATKTQEVGTEQVACGLELGASLGLKASAAGESGGWTLGLSGDAELDLVLRFFKLLKKDVKARDALTRTVRSLTSLFTVTSNTLQQGEIAVVDFRGMLKLGASMSYGWNVKGTKRVTPGLGVELVPHYQAKARLGLDADVTLANEFVVVAQRVADGPWVNVCFQKKRDRDLGLALNLDIDARLETKLGLNGEPKTDVGPFIDSLLGRTSLPDLIAELERFDSPEEIEAQLGELADDLAGRLSREIERVLGEPVAKIEAVLAPIRSRIEELLTAYRELDGEVAGFLGRALEKFESKSGIDAVIDTIEGLETTDDLLDVLVDEETGEQVRTVLKILEELFGTDFSQLALIDHPRGFGRIKELVGRYQQQTEGFLQAYADAYAWLKKQVRMDDAVERIEAFVAEDLTLEGLIDEQILWLNSYLEKELGESIDGIVAAVEPATRVLAKISKGYHKLVAKAKRALEDALNHELSVSANLAWSQIQTNQALASIDVNLDEAAGKRAMRQLMRGNLAEVMRMRLDNAHAIRFQRSHFLDLLRRDLSIRTVVNGREKIGITSYLVKTTAVLEPTDNGEVWVATTRAVETFRRRNRKALIDVGTMFEVSTMEEFLRVGRRLEGQDPEIADLSLDYAYREEIRDAISGSDLAARLIELDRDLELRPVPQDAFVSLLHGVEEVGQLGDLDDVVVEIGYAIDGNALQRLFGQRTPAETEARFEQAWDVAAQEVFGDLDAVMRIYGAWKDRDGQWDFAELESALGKLNIRERFLTRDLLNKRETVSRLMAKFHQDVFLNLRAERRKKIFKKLGQNMNWINRAELEPTRNFIMSVFSAAVEPTERGGSFVVHYTHPTAGLRMQLRAGVPSPARS